MVQSYLSELFPWEHSVFYLSHSSSNEDILIRKSQYATEQWDIIVQFTFKSVKFKS